MTEQNADTNEEGAGRLRPRKAVMQFARRMEGVLREHDWKGGWKRMRDVETIQKLMEESQELQGAIWISAHRSTQKADPPTVEDILKEAIDVANYAMMLLDNQDR